MIVSVDVTQDDINFGERRCMTRCMVARAIRRLVERDVIVEADDGNITLCRCSAGNVISCILDTPPTVGIMILRYDKGEPVIPFGFDLDIPEHFLRRKGNGSFLGQLTSAISMLPSMSLGIA